MKIRLVSVGKDKEFTAAGVAEYAARLRHFADLELVELRAETREKEADALLGKALKGPGELWALDERGAELTSRELAARLGRLRDLSLSLTLCIGGDEGLAEPVRTSARLVWSLSKLTLPHRFARMLVLEQLYRGFEILRGGPYHK